jgi:hypothetical protein
MSSKPVQASIDVPELIKRIKTVCCPECQKKIDKVQVPLTQVMTVAEIIKG